MYRNKRNPKIYKRQ